jgi:multiple sugar transport system substrate-binding protein
MLKSNSTSFKRLLMFVSVMLVMSLLAACGGNAKGNNASNTSNASSNNASSNQAAGGNAQGEATQQEPVEIRFAWWGSQGRHDRTLQAIELFEQKYPYITVIPEYSSWDGYWEKLSTQIAAKNAPDIMQMSILYIKEYSERGVLEDLNPFVGNQLNIENLNADVIANQGTVGGQLTGIPAADNASVLLVNKEIFTQAGVEAPVIDSTWDELLEKSRAIKAALGDGVYGLFDASSSLEAFMYYLFSKGDQLYSGNEFGFSDDNLRAWLEMWENAPANVTAAALPLSNADPNKDALLKGQVAMYGPTWIASFPAYEGVMTENVDMIAYPHAEKTGSVLQTAMFFSAAGETKHPEEVAMLIDFLVNSEEAANVLETERGLPENKNVRAYLEPRFTERDKKMINMLEHVSSIQPSMYDAGPKGAGEVTALFEQVVQKHQYGVITIDQAVKQIRVDGNKIFAKNNS